VINPDKTQTFFLLFSTKFFPLKGHHQSEQENKKCIIYSQFYMAPRSQNLTVFIFMWLYLIWKEQPLNKMCITMFIVFKKIGSGLYQHKINNNAKILEVKSVKCEYLFRGYSSRMYWK
jgi:hypothetical protein